MSQREFKSEFPNILPAKLLQEINERAASYDERNEFFAADFLALKDAGYLKSAVPKDLGGAGLGLIDLVQTQRTLAQAGPATALGVNMHLVWLAAANFLRLRGDSSLDLVLRAAAADEIFAFGSSEPGNDQGLFDSLTVAESDTYGNYLVSGTKIFTTLSPVWTRLGLHAKDENGQLVYGFVRRDYCGVRAQNEGSKGLKNGQITHPGTWNPLGMRATQSYVTVLDKVALLQEDVCAKFAPRDYSQPVISSVFHAFSILTASVYLGIAERALNLAVESLQIAFTNTAGEQVRAADDPNKSERFVNARLRLRAAINSVDLLAQRADTAVESQPDAFIALGAAKNQACNVARECVIEAVGLVGARAYQADSELARLYRDVLAGAFHPTSLASLAKMVRQELS